MKQIMITGAGAGLGAAIAKRFDQAGWRVGVMDINGDNAKTVAAGLKQAVPYAVDVTNEADVEAAFSDFGDKLDACVCNAGILRTGPLLEHSIEDFRLVTDINLVSVFITARAAARRMVGKGGGAIITMASINAINPSTNCGAYAAAKGGVITLSEQMSLEWGPDNIRVNTIAPGFIDAGMSSPFYEDDEIRELRSQATPLRKLGLAVDIAEMAFFLGSDISNYVSGQTIAVDGGVSNSVLLQLPRSH